MSALQLHVYRIKLMLRLREETLWVVRCMGHECSDLMFGISLVKVLLA